MTRDEVFRLVRSAIDTRLSFPGMPDDEWDDVAEAVLAAFAARGIVLGEMTKLTEEENNFWSDTFRDCDDAEDFTACLGGTVDNLALVRIVTND